MTNIKPATRHTWQRAAVRDLLEGGEEFRTAQQIHDRLRDEGARVGRPRLVEAHQRVDDRGMRVRAAARGPDGQGAGVSVDDGEVVVVVLLADEAAGILAERANLVLERLRIADELGLVEDAVDLLHDLVADLDAHADVHFVVGGFDAVLVRDLAQPRRAAASGGGHDVRRAHLVMLALVASIHVLNTAFDQQRHGWSGQARP